MPLRFDKKASGCLLAFVQAGTGLPATTAFEPQHEAVHLRSGPGVRINRFGHVAFADEFTDRRRRDGVLEVVEQAKDFVG